jgi:ribosomal protein S18 acetylase RimI-like enzyme
MTLTLRAYANESDYWRIRDFLRAVFLRNDRHEFSWPVQRLDYWRWHGNENLLHARLEDVIRIWETSDGRIAAVITPEGSGEAYFHVHPDCRTPELEADMLAAAENTLCATGADGAKRLSVYAHEGDALRTDLLARSGYVACDWPYSERRRDLTLPIPDGPPVPGYTLRALGDVDELPARSWASWRAFHPDSPDAEYEGWEWYLNIQRMPLYRRDLDIVAAAPGGVIAGFCTVWFDDVTRAGYFEPVGVTPEHQGRGLGRALMHEGLRQLRRMGGSLGTVAGASPAANALYAAAMSQAYDLCQRWEKVW